MVLPTHPPALGGIEEMKRPRGDMRACAVGDSPRRLSFAPPHRVAAYPLGKARADSPAAKSGEFASLSDEGDFILEWHFLLKRVVRAAVVRISQICRDRREISWQSFQREPDRSLRSR